MTGSAPRMALIWSYTNNSLDELTTKESEEVHSFRMTLEVAAVWVYWRYFQLAVSNPWLQATIVDTGMPIQEREQWADNYFEQVDEKRDAWLTIPFLRLFRDGRRALFQATVQKALWCWARSILLSVVLGRVHPHAQRLTLAQARLLEHLRCELSQCGAPSVRPERGRGFEVVCACVSDQDGKEAATAATVSKATNSRRHAI